jgi:CubicO group peptidase (beta-lactamase class C family)
MSTSYQQLLAAFLAPPPPETTGLVESKSLTKSAIGLAYAWAGIDESRLLVVINGKNVLVGDALRHTTGLSAEFDYFEFIEAPDATQLAIEKLSRPAAVRDTKFFEYDNYMSQILAAGFKKLSGGREIDDVLQEILGEDAEFRWTRDSTGTPLGPNGLFLNNASARRMGQRARELLQLHTRARVPSEHWAHEHNADILNYVHGWWETVNGTLIGIGYRAYYIVAAAEEDVKVQLFDDDYKSELTESQRTFAA